MNTRALVSMALALVFPGAGHFYLGRRARAIAFCAIVVLLFVVGLAIDGRLYVYGESRGQVITRIASLASMGSGALYFAGLAFGPAGDIRSMTFEYGRTFTLTAGLMNLLLVLDCWDIATGRKP
ncbi:MAG TPA: DUF6677 family protein [Thermoanaerobaculia bacterium]|nr:DUF6677 family protein [Thermoanaerobaculia bacterium]